jgi:cobalt-zinc-cadmium efflux system membrane fusion protein
MAAALAAAVAMPPTAPRAVAAGAGTFTPTKQQWDSLKFAAVARIDFRTERVTEGSIAIDDDLTTPVFSPYSGRVVRLIAGWGDHVNKGAPLFAVEASEYVQAVNDLITAVAAAKTARSQVAQAQINERRAHDLYLAKGGALKDWQQSQTDLRAAQNAADTTEIALAAVRNRMRILGQSETEIAAVENAPTQRIDPVQIVAAPIAGTVTQRQVGVGEYINSAANGASTPVYTVGDLSTVWLMGNVREADAGLVAIGTEADVRVPAYPGRVFKAKISWISASIDPNTHRLSVRADVENPDGALKPGMFADFTLLLGAPAPALAVPQSAIVYEGDQARVWIAPKDGELALREIKTGRTNGNMVEVVSGLSAGDKVVTSGTVFIDRAASSN